ncbi:MAG TPA: hypothetical protein VMX17_06000 [Candidatus Glassbacteria bacterium]|nr:hypothetical protein [Candidatus Glassbacteria bacterium]
MKIDNQKSKISKIQLKVVTYKRKLYEEQIKLSKSKLKEQASKSIHHLFSGDGIRYETVCGCPLIHETGKKKDFNFDDGHKFKNATYYFYNAENKCPICAYNDRVPNDDCPKCGIFRDTPKHTYCGNCGKVTGKRRKIRIPNLETSLE